MALPFSQENTAIIIDYKIKVSISQMYSQHAFEHDMYFLFCFELFIVRNNK